MEQILERLADLEKRLALLENKETTTKQEFYDFINAEWKTTFDAVYNTDHESKIHEYQQIDTTKIYDNNYYINRSLIYGIRFTLISMIVIIPTILLR